MLGVLFKRCNLAVWHAHVNVRGALVPLTGRGTVHILSNTVLADLMAGMVTERAGNDGHAECARPLRTFMSPMAANGLGMPPPCNDQKAYRHQ